MNQSEIIKNMSDRDLTQSIIVSQLLFLFVSIILSFFLFNHFSDWLNYFRFDVLEILYFGLVPGLLIIFLDLCLMYFLPKKVFDDGGINERVFKNRSIGNIFILTTIIAISEELLFRGVIQTTFGFVFASILFALAHIRYLKKPVLLILVVFISFYLGYLFERTGNLFVTIIAHFVVNFLLGITIRYQN